MVFKLYSPPFCIVTLQMCNVFLASYPLLFHNTLNYFPFLFFWVIEVPEATIFPYYSLVGMGGGGGVNDKLAWNWMFRLRITQLRLIKGLSSYTFTFLFFLIYFHINIVSKMLYQLF